MLFLRDIGLCYESKLTSFNIVRKLPKDEVEAEIAILITTTTNVARQMIRCFSTYHLYSRLWGLQKNERMMLKYRTLTFTTRVLILPQKIQRKSNHQTTIQIYHGGLNLMVLLVMGSLCLLLLRYDIIPAGKVAIMRAYNNDWFRRFLHELALCSKNRWTLVKPNKYGLYYSN